MLIEVSIIHFAKHMKVEFYDIPAVLHPLNDTKGWDHWGVFIDDVSYPEGYGEAYKGNGIHAGYGCAVL